VQALIDLPNPSNTLSSVGEFYDSIKRHIRSLTALGRTEETCGSLLTTILLGKIPVKNMARVHGKQEWTITELQTSIRDELNILEIGLQMEPHVVLLPTALFHSSVTKPKGKMQCPLCKGIYSASLCEQIMDLRQQTNIIRQDRLCFNCLGHHKISDCKSKHRCHHCQQKHHTSLYTSEHQQTDSSTPGHSGTVTNPRKHQYGALQQYSNTPQPRKEISGTPQLQPIPPPVNLNPMIQAHSQ